MLDFSRFFLNPFNDPGIAIDEIVSYSNEHLQRLVANNPGALFNARINITTVALNGLDQTLTTEHTKLAVQKGATRAKEIYRDALPANIARIYGAAVAAFGVNSALLMECFPHGREIFGDCVDSALENHLQQLQACLNPHAAAVGASHISDLGGLVSTWIGLYSAASSARGVRNTSAEARRIAMDTLRVELFKNLLTLAVAFPDQVEKAAVYCPQYLLEDHPPAEELPSAVNQ